jgi:hypothetical protein
LAARTDSNPSFSLERALIYLCNMLIIKYLRIQIFPVALLLLNPKSFSKRFVDSIGTLASNNVFAEAVKILT